MQKKSQSFAFAYKYVFGTIHYWNHLFHIDRQLWKLLETNNCECIKLHIKRIYNFFFWNLCSIANWTSKCNTILATHLASISAIHLQMQGGTVNICNKPARERETVRELQWYVKKTTRRACLFSSTHLNCTLCVLLPYSTNIVFFYSPRNPHHFYRLRLHALYLVLSVCALCSTEKIIRQCICMNSLDKYSTC